MLLALQVKVGKVASFAGKIFLASPTKTTNILPHEITSYIRYSAGLFSLSDVQSMVCEVNKMHDFNHPYIMSLIGVCLDAGPGIAIVMPYMANGSLVDYLKRERSSLELDDDCDTDQVCGILIMPKYACASEVYGSVFVYGACVSL